MNTVELTALIERYNEDDDEFAIAMNFLVGGVGNVQDVITTIHAKTFEPTRHVAVLAEADRMLAFARGRVGDGPLGDFLDRYRGFVTQMLRITS